jgi:site-specific recombinase XerD
MTLALWTSHPEAAYAQWQRTEAAGADRRAFAERSIVQHCAMFARFNRFLVGHRQTMTTFGSDHIDGFFGELARDCSPGTTTRLRYLKLIDRLVRHLVAMELRSANPAAQMLAAESWPEDEPTPIYLSLADDGRFQSACRPQPGMDFKALRNTAIVAILLGAGITAAECRYLRLSDLDIDGIRPDVSVQKRGPRIARRVPLEAFSLKVLREYHDARVKLACQSEWLFLATAAGKPMKDDTLGKYVRLALQTLEITAADMSPRLLRNTYARRHLHAGRTDEEVANLLGLSSHRTSVRLRQTLDPSFASPECEYESMDSEIG